MAALHCGCIPRHDWPRPGYAPHSGPGCVARVALVVSDLRDGSGLHVEFTNGQRRNLINHWGNRCPRVFNIHGGHLSSLFRVLVGVLIGRGGVFRVSLFVFSVVGGAGLVAVLFGCSHDLS